ncbi:MAG: hypothetical protein JWQ64_3805 [Subtercola sp.]|nr:hypothetical protein [Subtercola sp.]
MTDDSTPEHEHIGEPAADAAVAPSADAAEATEVADALNADGTSEPTAGTAADTGTPPTTADTGYVLSRRDRTAVKLIDWAVNFGTPEFQARYRPVSDELFTHHFIDPTAKPAFVPPAIVSIEQLDSASDPLEIIRSHLGLVMDDRQSRDKARLDAQTRYEEAAQSLAELQARAAGLESDLADTTERLHVADAAIVTLTARLETEVSGLHTSYTAQLDELHAQLESDASAQRNAHEAEIAQLTAEHEAAVARLAGEHSTTLGSVTTGHEEEFAALAAAHATELTAAEARHIDTVASLESMHSGRAEAAGLALAAAVSTAEVTTVQLKEARLEAAALTAQRDRAIAEGSEWRSRLQQVVAGLASTADVGEWTDSNAPDARLVEFIEETQLDLTTQLELAQATLDEIEDVATAQLVDETETSDYAIGANDAAVLILNSLYGADDEGDLEGADIDAAEIEAGESESEEGESANTEAASPDGAQADSVRDSEAETNSADTEFTNALQSEVDVEFDEFAAEAEAHRTS